MNTGNYILLSVIGSILIVVIAAGVFYSEVWEGVEQDREKLTKELQDLNTHLSGLANIDAEKKRLQDEIEELKKKKKKLQTDSVVLDDVVPLLLDSIEMTANKFDIKFQDIRISPLVRAEDWSELPIEMTIQGTFYNIASFLTVVEKRKLVNLAAGSMNISVSSEVDKETGSPVLSVQLTAKVYIL